MEKIKIFSLSNYVHVVCSFFLSLGNRESIGVIVIKKEWIFLLLLLRIINGIESEL